MNILWMVLGAIGKAVGSKKAHFIFFKITFLVIITHAPNLV